MSTQNGQSGDEVQSEILRQLKDLNSKVDVLTVDMGVVKVAVKGLGDRMERIESRMDGVEREIVVLKGLVQRN